MLLSVSRRGNLVRICLFQLTSKCNGHNGKIENRKREHERPLLSFSRYQLVKGNSARVFLKFLENIGALFLRVVICTSKVGRCTSIHGPRVKPSEKDQNTPFLSLLAQPSGHLPPMFAAQLHPLSLPQRPPPLGPNNILSCYHWVAEREWEENGRQLGEKERERVEVALGEGGMRRWRGGGVGGEHRERQGEGERGRRRRVRGILVFS